jgi:hypothetical protein
VLHDVDEGHWARSSKQREGAKQAIDTFLPNLNTFQRLLVDVSASHAAFV